LLALILNVEASGTINTIDLIGVGIEFIEKLIEIGEIATRLIYTIRIKVSRKCS
jgi:hypothetical protein